MSRNDSKIVSEKEQEQSYSAYATMEDLLDKLKLLNYEAEFLKDLKMKPIHRFYFVVTKNPGEQFYLFSLLATFLIRKLGIPMEKPEEFDDPNDTVEKILNIVTTNGITVDFTANKLKQGVGEQVVYVLDNLANLALSKNNFIWKKPNIPKEKEEGAEQIDDESEINLDRVEEEMLAAYSDDSDEDNILLIDNLKRTKKELQVSELNTTIDEESWKLELERILPQLKITIKSENRDWRAHLDQMKQHKVHIDGSLDVARNQLQKLHKEISVTLDKVGNREKYINRELDSVLDEYRTLQDQLSKIRDSYRDISGGVSERNRELSRLTDRLEVVKQQMEERGSSMTDGTPLVNIKKSVARIKAEIIDMDVRVGVLECILLQSRVRDEKIMENEFGGMVSVY